jgi:phosphoenolpyruvate carboxylase
MDKQNSSPNKRFRSDLTNVRAKQTITNNKQQQQQQQRTTQLPYRNSNHYQRQQESMPASSPIQENFEENNKQIIYDIDLNMNCFDEQLSDCQMKHCPVKVSGAFLCNRA